MIYVNANLNLIHKQTFRPWYELPHYKIMPIVSDHFRSLFNRHRKTDLTKKKKKKKKKKEKKKKKKKKK